MRQGERGEAGAGSRSGGSAREQGDERRSKDPNRQQATVHGFPLEWCARRPRGERDLAPCRFADQDAASRDAGRIRSGGSAGGGVVRPLTVSSTLLTATVQLHLPCAGDEPGYFARRVEVGMV